MFWGYNDTSSQIENYFDVVVLSDDVGVNKPNRRIFDFALEKAGATAIESVIIGDNPDADIVGAVIAGWRAIFFNPNDDCKASTLPKEVEIITELREIEHIL